MTQVLQHTGNEEILNQPQVLAIAREVQGSDQASSNSSDSNRLTQQVTPGVFAMP